MDASVLYNNTDPTVNVAVIEAIKALIAWQTAAGDPLPNQTGSEEEQAWTRTTAVVAATTGLPQDVVETSLKGSRGFWWNTIESLHRDMERACPDHIAVADFCHGVFGELHLPLSERGMSNEGFLVYVVTLHKQRRPGCPGFTATAEALARDPHHGATRTWVEENEWH